MGRSITFCCASELVIVSSAAYRIEETDCFSSLFVCHSQKSHNKTYGAPLTLCIAMSVFIRLE